MPDLCFPLKLNTSPGENKVTTAPDRAGCSCGVGGTVAPPSPTSALHEQVSRHGLKHRKTLIIKRRKDALTSQTTSRVTNDGAE